MENIIMLSLGVFISVVGIVNIKGNISTIQDVYKRQSEIRSEGEIRNVWDLMEDYYSDTKDNSCLLYTSRCV